MNFETRVASGIALLNKEYPGWSASIDLEALDLEGCEDCVLGQVFGHYLEGVKMLGISNDILGDGYLKVQSAHGFDLTREEYDEYASLDLIYQKLTAEWVRQIEQLRNTP